MRTENRISKWQILSIVGALGGVVAGSVAVMVYEVWPFMQVYNWLLPEVGPTFAAGPVVIAVGVMLIAVLCLAGWLIARFRGTE